VDVSNQLPGRAITLDGKDRYPVFGIGYAYDTRDLGEYPSDGTLMRASVTKFGVSTATVNIVRYEADIRRYQPLLPRMTLAGRVFTNLVAAGPTPSYNRTFFGYGERIRGHFRDVVEGEHIFGTSFELHYTLLPPKYFSVGALPSEFGIWRFGVVAATFVDAGTVWFRGEPFALDRFLRGYGVGLHFLLPYSFVLRTEYAWNELRRSEFIIDVGAAL
jgi:outer membrane protein assembly factor BamA